MAFTISDYVRLRPFAYHLTDRANLPTLIDQAVLQSAADLLIRAGMPSAIRSRRGALMPIVIDGRCVVLKDQRPLVLANAELTDGWTAGDFVEHLNRHVFFWPGNEQGPVKYGARLFDAYEADAPLVLRTPTTDLLEANRAITPLFCPFNSGAPRMQNGRRVPRGPALFTKAEVFPRRASEVVELVFCGTVTLPTSTEVRLPGEPWCALVRAAV